jgi:hypothetical protein
MDRRLPQETVLFEMSEFQVLFTEYPQLKSLKHCNTRFRNSTSDPALQSSNRLMHTYTLVVLGSILGLESLQRFLVILSFKCACFLLAWNFDCHAIDRTQIYGVCEQSGEENFST